MPIVRNKTEKIKMASYLEAGTECFEVVIFQAASQLDLGSLRDHKNMLLSEFLNGKGVFCNRFWQIFVSLQVSSLTLPRYDLQLLQKFCCSCVAPYI